MTTPPTRAVCLHGHFYQPPRENPWLDVIEPQPSAAPHRDWNARVTAECYTPLSQATLDPLHSGDPVAGLINADFGPTLLAWLQRHRPDTYAALLAADQHSLRAFNGHGGAIAQAYNHIILPLATPRDRRTQIVWGLRDFQHRFGRPSSGIWLAETAVDLPTLDLLAEHGVRFTILSPHQAARVRPSPDAPWRATPHASIDPRRPYLQRLPSGRDIALFFYDPAISGDIAFGDLLDDGDRFADRLLQGFDDRTSPQLVHVATDGETYGHHRRRGVQALTQALGRLQRTEGVHLTTYDQHLTRHPPTWEVQIASPSSWSCAHGVERWRSDCGCRGRHDWHQRWRAPLRDALDYLRDALANPWRRAASRLLTDPWAARDDAIALHHAYDDALAAQHAAQHTQDTAPPPGDRPRRIAADPELAEARRAFFAAHGARPLRQGEQLRALELLELQRQAMFMYTSCGWFFDEISGIETVQVLQYAARVAELATRLLPGGAHVADAFRARLIAAPSNNPDFRDGRQVYDALAQAGRPGSR